MTAGLPPPQPPSRPLDLPRLLMRRAGAVAAVVLVLAVLLGLWRLNLDIDDEVDAGLHLATVMATVGQAQAMSDAQLLNALKARQPEVWHYRFDWDELPPPFDVVYGAAHSFDLPFIFGNFGSSLYANISFSRANEPGRLALSQRMMQSLGAFARAGDPNTAILGTRWPAWPGRLVLDADRQSAKLAVE